MGRWRAWCSAAAGRRCGKLLLEGSCSDGPLGLRVQGPVFPLPQQTEKGLQRPRSEQWSCWLRSSGGRPPPSECNDLERLLLGNGAVRPVTRMLPCVPPFSTEPWPQGRGCQGSGCFWEWGSRAERRGLAGTRGTE